jgi:3-hydroxyisobutyrate dehydrogenase-like beta-hydroxyacid dehydrogenase
MDTNKASQRIALIGVGLMGHGIAINLVKHGHTLAVLEHPGNQPLDALKAAGVTTQRSAKALAQGADVVMLCVTGSAQVEAVLLGDDGVIAGLRRDAVVIDCSTAIPSSTERMAQAVQAVGARFLDAPMTRTPKEAAEGRLNLLVGGDAALFAQCRPLLSGFAENITYVGPVGSGHRMKLLHNFVSLGFIALLSEAAACAQRSGVAADVLVDVLAKGGGGSVALERLKPYLLTHDGSSLRFAMSNAVKDIGYYQTMARDAGAAAAIADAVLRDYQFGLAAGGEQAAAIELSTWLASAQHTVGG